MKDKTPEINKGKKTDKKPLSPSDKSRTTAAPLPGLSKKTRPELIALAESLGISTEEKDRRIDLIEKINAHRPGSSESTPRKEAFKAPLPKSSGKSPAKKRTAAKSTSASPPEDTPVPAPATSPERELPPTVIPGAPGWKDFLDIPFEPFRREKGHFVTILPLSPFRIMAFFGTDPTDSSPAFRNGHPDIVLKIRDITKAMEEKPRPMVDDLPADYVFDVGTGMSDRWRIPIWSTHRWIEAWLGYYEDGNFRILARSKKIRTPRGGPSRRWGNLFHLKEGGYLEKDLPWLSEDAAIRRLARLPSSHDRPASHTRP
ncbi:MAG: hypothetical protein ACP5OP_07935 [Leptospirillia bacterium]